MCGATDTLSRRSLISRHASPASQTAVVPVWVRVFRVVRVFTYILLLCDTYFDTSGSDFSVSSTCVIRKIAGLYIQVVTTSLVPTVLFFFASVFFLKEKTNGA